MEKESQSSINKERSSEVEQYAEEDEYPEGGRDAILTVIGAFLVDFAQTGVSACVGILQYEYAASLLKGHTASQISWLGTFQLFFYYFAGAFVGRLFDSVGPTVLLVPGTFLMVFGLMMLSLCKEYYQFFLVQAFLIGGGMALVYYPALSSIAHFYKKKRATMFGVTTAGSSIGAVIFPIVLNKLIPVVGFPWTARIMGFMCLAFLLPSIFLVRSRLPRRKFTGFSGLVDFGGLKDVRYVLFAAGAVLSGLGMYNPNYYIQTFAGTRGYPENILTYIVSIQNAGSFFGRLIPGFLADQFGMLNVMVFASTAGSIMVFCWLSVSGNASLVIWGLFYGFAGGAVINLLPAAVGIFTPDMTKYGGRAGLVFALTSFAALSGPPIAGALLDQAHGDFLHLIVFSGTVCIVGTLFYWAARFASNPRIFAKC